MRVSTAQHELALSILPLEPPSHHPLIFKNVEYTKAVQD